MPCGYFDRFCRHDKGAAETGSRRQIEDGGIDIIDRKSVTGIGAMPNQALWRQIGIVFTVFTIVLMASYFSMTATKPDLDDSARQAAPGTFVRLSDGIVHFQAAGPEDAPTVLFVHGLATPSFIWDYNFTRLADAGFRTFRYDHYGRGFSDRPRLVYDRDLYDRQLFELITKLNIRTPVNLVGLSMGGAVVIGFTDRHPEMVARICLIAPAGFPIEVPFAANVAMMPLIGEVLTALIGDRVVLEGVRNAFIDPGKLTDYEKKFKLSLKYRGFHHALLSTLRHMDMHNLGEVYRRVGRRKIPVLLIWGRHDRVLPYANSRKVLTAIPTAEFQAIDGGGHNLNYENPDAVNPLLIDFFRRTH